MLFNSLTFLLFFIIVFVGHRLLPSASVQKSWLLAASYVFYGAWNLAYVLVLLFSTTLDWMLARRIWHARGTRRRRRLLVLSLLSNLSLLGFFKYANFFVENISAVLLPIGIVYTAPPLDIVLPIGISFYTFASLSYTIDVYRGEIRGDCKFLDYALFVSFFPHLVAGPIVRARTLLPQIENPLPPTRDQIGWGLTLVVMGLFAKVVLADAVFSPVVDTIYASPNQFDTFSVWVAVFSFSGQIYYDFGGYSLCAIGLALCFGYSFPDNFRHPYAARGFVDFWRRWHISLSTWLRDYLYIPLGGNRLGTLRTVINLLLTMLLGGLWHGASWMFVLWGGLHGTLLALEHLLHRHLQRSPALLPGNQFTLTAFTFLVVTLAWIPFRAETPANATAVVSALFTLTPVSGVDIEMIIAAVAIVITFRWHLLLRDTTLESIFVRMSAPIQTALISTCLIGLFLLSGGDQRAFIYFQF